MSLNEQKGQSALEYLMTYGWALIVIVIVIAALVFLINPSQIGTEGCTGFQRLPIGNFLMSDTGLELKVTNQTGRTLSSVTFQASFDGDAYGNSNEFDGSQAIAANAEEDVTWTQALTAGSHTVDLNVSYNDGDFARTATGSCRATI
mgnify:CR=1 FL=1